MQQPIQYKFRSAMAFDRLKVPGGNFVHLFDIKKAIVKAKKLDAGRTMDFDLSVSNEKTGEEYKYENMVLPRTTRFIVQRLPVTTKGHGLIQRIARDERISSNNKSDNTLNAVDIKTFYTIDARKQDMEEEFVVANPNTADGEVNSAEENEELRALEAATRAVLDLEPMRPPLSTATRARVNSQYQKRNARQANPDPEIREREKHNLPEKRFIGVPERFRNTILLQQKKDTTTTVGSIVPNVREFEELKRRTTICNPRTAFETALQVTGVSIPEYLTCAVCQKLVENPVNLHWDPAGRTACEGCMRQKLSAAFCCPVTGIEGISPDELHLNKPLQRAATAFMEQVNAEFSAIQNESRKVKAGPEEQSDIETSERGPDQDQGEKQNVTMSKSAREGSENADFGGDVFAAEASSQEKVSPADAEIKTSSQKKTSELVLGQRGTQQVDTRRPSTHRAATPPVKGHRGERFRGRPKWDSRRDFNVKRKVRKDLVLSFPVISFYPRGPRGAYRGPPPKGPRPEANQRTTKDSQ